MSIFYKRTAAKIPAECEGMTVMCKSSACTGETTIGFYDRRTDRLMYAELVRTEEDVEAFCRRYGIDRSQVQGRKRH